MRSSWAQPSLSRDFALLSAAVLFTLVLISGWVTYTTYMRHSERVTSDLEKESIRIERTLASEMNNASYMLTALGRQIVLDPNRDYVRLAQMLKSFDSKGYIYTIFSWVNPDQRLVVSSNRGVLEEPVDISDRDYVQKGAVDPWKMHIGRPIEGRVSGRWVIPVAMGITDYTGKFIGTIMISIDIGTLTDQISNLVKRDGISFAIASKTLVPLTQVSENKNFVTDNFPTQKLVNVEFSENPSGLITRGSLFFGSENYAYYRVSDTYPYIIILGYDASYSDETVRTLLWSRLLQLLGMAIFFMLFLWIVRVRVIKPVLNMTDLIAKVAKGEGYVAPSRKGPAPVEIGALAAQVQHVSQYIDENKRVEDELRNKLFMLKRAKENAEISLRSKAEFLAYFTQEMRMPLNNIVGFAQVLKDQLYGPIENKKYRQYVADIFHTGNQLINKMQDVLLQSKIETGYVGLQEKTLEISAFVQAALRQLNDTLQAKALTVKTSIPDGLPQLHADEFRLRQLLMNILLVAADTPAAEAIWLEVRLLNENRDKQYLVLAVATSASAMPASDKLLALAETSMVETHKTDQEMDLRLQLAKTLAQAHEAHFNITKPLENGGCFVMVFPSSSLRFQDLD